MRNNDIDALRVKYINTVGYWQALYFRTNNIINGYYSENNKRSICVTRNFHR